MDRFVTRITVILTTIYFITSYVFAQCGVDILTGSYVLLFEACVVTYTFCSGKYHCKHIRWSSASILICDILNHTDYYFDYIPVSMANIIPIAILAIGMSATTYLSIRHFFTIRKKKKRNVDNGRSKSSDR